MAGMFDWLKGGKGKGRARRRSSSGSRGSAGKRRTAQRRDPENRTEFVGRQQPEPPPTRGGQDALAPPPVMPAPAPASTTADQPPRPAVADAGATQYHAVSAAGKDVLVAVLIVKEGSARDEVYKIYDGENTIGRGDTARVRTDGRDGAVSREHATIIHESGSFGVKPLKQGKNPTFLNDEEVLGGAPLADGDLIRIGNTILKFRVT